MKKLRQDMAELSSTVQDLEKRVNINDAQGSRAPASKSSSSPLVKISGVQAGESNAPRPNVPKAPQFVGPTRSAYSIEIGQRSLTRMGIPSYDLPSPSAPQSPVERSSDVATSATDFWQRTNAAEVSRLLFVFQEEVESVYPVIDCTTLASYAQQILDYGRESQNEAFFSQGADALAFSLKDFQMAVIGVATALVIEAHEAFETSEAMVESVERTVSRISKPEVDIKGLQLFAILVRLATLSLSPSPV
jgi:hypothetical protein